MNITFFDPRCTDEAHPNGQQLTVIATTLKEYTDNRTAILDPERGITLIDPVELPETPDPAWFPPIPDDIEELKKEVKDLEDSFDALMEGLI